MVHAEVAHHIPGRLRLKVREAKRDAALLDRIARTVAAIDGARRVSTNPLTGSIVVEYERESRVFLSDVIAAGARSDTFRLESGGNSVLGVAKTRQWRKVAGRSLLALGVAGLMLPVIPGAPFLIAGAAVLGSDDPLVARGADLVRSLVGRR